MWKHKLVLVYIYDPATLALIKCPFSKFLKKKCFTRLFLQIFWMDYHIIMKYKTFPDSLCWFWQSVEWLLCEELGNFLQISKGCGIYARSRVPLPVPTVRKLTLAYEWCPLITNVNKQAQQEHKRKRKHWCGFTYGI